MIYVLGSANADLVFRTATLPRPGETLTAESFVVQPGGKGANQAVAAARLGSEVAFVGCLGSDANGEMLRQVLRADGINLDLTPSTDAVPTGCAGIIVDDQGMNCIVVNQGSNSLVSSARIPDGSFVLAQLEIPLEAVLDAARRAETFILNPAPARELPDELVALCRWITPNETEAEALTGILPIDEASTRQAAQQLLDRGAKNVVITLGAKGVFWRSTEGEAMFDAPAVEVVDTTSAGDAFNGALARFLESGMAAREAIENAVRFASLKVTKAGAVSGIPSRAEFDAWTGP